MLVNTSFNVRDEPIVCSPAEAYRCFMRTEMDVLVLEDAILLKEDQPSWKEPTPESDPQTTRPKDPAVDAALARFFSEHLLPVKEELRERGATFFARKAEPALASFFVAPISIEDEIGDDMDVLRELWGRGDQPILSDLIQPLTDLISEVREPLQKEDEGRLSSTIYQMY